MRKRKRDEAVWLASTGTLTSANPLNKSEILLDLNYSDQFLFRNSAFWFSEFTPNGVITLRQLSLDE